MERMKFDSQGTLVGVDGSLIKESDRGKGIRKRDRYNGNNWNNGDNGENDEHGEYKSEKLKRSEDLEFLKEEGEEKVGIEEEKRTEDIFEKSYWNLFSGKEALAPLKFSNGKTQEDVVKEIVSLIENGKKIIFLHGTCGTGKSAIALNIARVLGSASIVVPVKALQKQYEEDYMGNKWLNMDSKRKMKIAMITGRDNHDSLFFPGKSCADPSLPENIKITEKNYEKIKEYYEENPLIRNKVNVDMDRIRRMSIAPANPYWSPILPADFEAKQFHDATKRRYKGCDGKDYVFYHRKRGCSYYDQYLSYLMADVNIFNSAKYLAEINIGRKPETEVEIIDEADDFLDSLFIQEEINLTRLKAALKLIFPESKSAKDVIDEIISLIDLEEKNKRALGIDEDAIFKISDTKISKVLKLLNSNQELKAEIALDELNYSNRVLTVAEDFLRVIDEVYLSYRKDEDDNLYSKIVSTNLKSKIDELISKSKAIVFMSGTLHSPEVLKRVFKISDYETVEAETLNFGNVEIIRTGKEFDCKYTNFSNGSKTREDYLTALNSCVERAKLPLLVHVNAFQDLPSDEDKMSFEVNSLMSNEKLKEIQKEDKTGRAVSIFKQGLSDSLFTTKCSRGVDFPGDVCKSMIFTKYPNPNMQDTFWKVLMKTHSDYFWDFYKDKARREFLQRLYRALRSMDDHVYILSPDLRVLEAVQGLQKQNGEI
ncbi:hypothetical protein CMI45_02490 [Candidatus Pacearchaeota archaeon]|nr:hypothetical protein [Candidatus Pacearchaeota archaeon]|tara:strand:+ start:1105 stop:3234 length:2130 start_codon:yes stop_codon:yes gene_type:complete